MPWQPAKLQYNASLPSQRSVSSLLSRNYKTYILRTVHEKLFPFCIQIDMLYDINNKTYFKKKNVRHA